jgi:hypothetical protein
LQVRLLVVPRLAVATAQLRPGAVAKRYAGRVAVRGGAKPFRWTATGLPAGVRLATTTGALSGTPKRPGRFRVFVRVRDAIGVVSSRTFVLTIR